MKSAKPDEFVSIDDATEYGLSRSIIYRLVRRGELTTFRRVGEPKSYVERKRIEALVRFRPKGKTEAGRQARKGGG